MITIVYELNRSALDRTINFLEEKLATKITTIHLGELNSIADMDPEREILSLHLDLVSEIASHKMISSFANRYKLKQLNPYSKATELVDNKFAFFNLMLANNIRQAETVLLNRDTKAKLSELLTLIQGCCECEKIIVKPCHGTEKIDVAIFNKSAFFNEEHLQHQISKHINQILSYDDCIVQQYFESSSEIRVLYLKGCLHSSQKIDQELKELVEEAVEVINYGLDSANQLEAIAFDILETSCCASAKNERYLILEANSRPAAMFKSVN